MTVSVTTNIVSFAGNDSTTSFPFTFKTQDAGDIKGYLTETDGTITVLVKDTDYSVALNGDGTGTVTYPISGSPLATGETLRVSREVDMDQTVDLSIGGPYDPEAVEDALDHLTNQVQQLQEEMNRAIRAPAGDAALNELGAAEARKNLALTFNSSTGQPEVTQIPGVSATISADTINEYTADNGVTVDGVLHKDGVLTLGGTSDALLGNDTDGITTISAGISVNLGANIRLYGDTHATQASDLILRSNTTDIAHYDLSATKWDFQANDVQVDTDTLYVDAANDRVGVNTDTPSTALDVKGTILVTTDETATTDGFLYLGADGTNHGARIRYGSGSDTLQFGTSHNSTHLYITSAGAIYTPNATGGAQGADTINAKNYYKDGVAFGTGTGDLLAANNLSDLGSASTARTNLGLGALATLATVGSAQIDTDAVTAAEIAAGAVGSSEIATNAVTTTELADNAVALVNMAHGTAGDLIYMNGSGAPTYLGIGSAGQVLKVSSGVPTWSADSGGWTKHGTVHTGISGAGVAWTSIPAGTQHVKVVVSDISATGADDLGFQCDSKTTYNGRVRTASGGANWGSYAQVTNGSGGADLVNGIITFTQLTTGASSTWLIEAQFLTEGGGFHVSSGTVVVTTDIDRVDMDWVGSETFDNGNAALYYQ